MQKSIIYCPICGVECRNPLVLREHRIVSHKGIYQSSQLSARVIFVPK